MQKDFDDLSTASLSVAEELFEVGEEVQLQM
jgi:hypothetical protein